MILEIGKNYCLSEYRNNFLGMHVIQFSKPEEERGELNIWAKKLEIDEQKLWESKNANETLKVIRKSAEKVGMKNIDLNKLIDNLPYKDRVDVGLGFATPKKSCINSAYKIADTENYEFPELGFYSSLAFLMDSSARKLQSNNTDDPRVKIYLNKKIEQMKRFLDSGRDFKKVNF